MENDPETPSRPPPIAVPPLLLPKEDKFSRKDEELNEIPGDASMSSWAIVQYTFVGFLAGLLLNLVGYCFSHLIATKPPMLRKAFLIGCLVGFTINFTLIVLLLRLFPRRSNTQRVSTV